MMEIITIRDPAQPVSVRRYLGSHRNADTSVCPGVFCSPLACCLLPATIPKFDIKQEIPSVTLPFILN